MRYAASALRAGTVSSFSVQPGAWPSAWHTEGHTSGTVEWFNPLADRKLWCRCLFPQETCLTLWCNLRLKWEPGASLPCEGKGMLAPSVGLPFSGWDCLCRKREDDQEAWFWMSLALPLSWGRERAGSCQDTSPRQPSLCSL